MIWFFLCSLMLLYGAIQVWTGRMTSDKYADYLQLSVGIVVMTALIDGIIMKTYMFVPGVLRWISSL